MDLRKLEEMLDLALTEEIKQPMELGDLIISELKDWESDLLERVSPIDNMDEVADQYGYKLYGADGYPGNALVIDVKGRPDIKEPLLSELNDKFGNDAVYQIIFDEIQTFIDFELSEDYPDLVVAGRSGGYWGLPELEKHLYITDEGYEAMKNRVAELLNDPNLYYKEVLDDAVTDEDITQAIYSVVNGDTQEIANVLVTADNTIDVQPDFLERMKNLCDRIDEKEQEMNTKGFWSKYE